MGEALCRLYGDLVVTHWQGLAVAQVLHILAAALPQQCAQQQEVLSLLASSWYVYLDTFSVGYGHGMWYRLVKLLKVDQSTLSRGRCVCNLVSSMVWNRLWYLLGRLAIAIVWGWVQQQVQQCGAVQDGDLKKISQRSWVTQSDSEMSGEAGFWVRIWQVTSCLCASSAKNLWTLRTLENSGVLWSTLEFSKFKDFLLMLTCSSLSCSGWKVISGPSLTGVVAVWVTLWLRPNWPPLGKSKSNNFFAGLKRVVVVWVTLQLRPNWPPWKTQTPVSAWTYIHWALHYSTTLSPFGLCGQHIDLPVLCWHLVAFSYLGLLNITQHPIPVLIGCKMMKNCRLWLSWQSTVHQVLRQVHHVHMPPCWI